MNHVYTILNRESRINHTGCDENCHTSRNPCACRPKAGNIRATTLQTVVTNSAVTSTASALLADPLHNYAGLGRDMSKMK